MDHNTVTSDLALVEAVTRHGSTEVVAELAPLGAEASTAEAREHGMLANEHEPRSGRTRTCAGPPGSSPGRRPSRATAARSR